jgi:hypothetical protein
VVDDPLKKIAWQFALWRAFEVPDIVDDKAALAAIEFDLVKDVPTPHDFDPWPVAHGFVEAVLELAPAGDLDDIFFPETKDASCGIG